MKPLPLVIEDRGFRYTQIARQGDVAVYSQGGIGAKSIVFAYEVIVIQSHNGREAFGKTYPPTEYYPSVNQWGKHGFTISGYPDNRAVALARMDSLIVERAIAAEERAAWAVKKAQKAAEGA